MIEAAAEQEQGAPQLNEAASQMGKLTEQDPALVGQAATIASSVPDRTIRLAERERAGCDPASEGSIRRDITVLSPTRVCLAR